MSKNCPKCEKVFTRVADVQVHLDKKTPCDFACRTCGEKLSCFAEYKKHQADVHAVVMPSRKQKPRAGDDKAIVKREALPIQDAIVPAASNDIPDIEQIPLIPMDDFIGQAQMDAIVSRIIETSKRDATEGQNIVILNIININNNININNVNVADPVDVAAKTFRGKDFGTAMKCLQYPQQTTKIAADILTQMHSDPNRPEMHTVKMKDMARKKMSLYSRPSQNAPGEWLPYGHKAALKKLSEHAAWLVHSALCGGVNIGSYKIREIDFVLCFQLPTLIDGKVITVYDQSTVDPEYRPMSLKVELYSGELFDLPDNEDAHREQTRLEGVIKKRGREVIRLLKEIEFTDKDIGDFLESTQRLR